MKVMRILGYVFAAVLFAGGLLFFVAASHTGLTGRWVMGGVLVAAALLIALFIKMRPPPQQVSVTQRLAITDGDKLERLDCERCGASLDQTCIKAEQGVVLVNCRYCGASYELKEELQW